MVFVAFSVKSAGRTCFGDSPVPATMPRPFMRQLLVPKLLTYDLGCARKSSENPLLRTQHISL